MRSRCSQRVFSFCGYLRDRHRQDAELRRERLQYGARQVSRVGQEMTAPAQGAKLDGEAETVDASATLLNLNQIGVAQREILLQHSRINLRRQAILWLRVG